MATNISVALARTIAHLDAQSATHAKDRQRAKEARTRIAALQGIRTNDRPVETLKFPSLGGGFSLGADCRELSSHQHKELHVATVRQRSFYLRSEVRADGRHRWRKRKTKGVHSLAVTVRPDYAMVLAALERSPKYRHLVRPFLIQLAADLAGEFVALTGLEVISIQVHPEEGCLHYHITYATVSADNRLLWTNRSTGRKGLRCLGPWHIGNLRLALAGYVPKEDAGLAIADLKRVQSLHGAPPADWLLAVAVEGRCEVFIEKHGLHAEFAAAASRYGQAVRERRAQRPDQLKARAEQAESERTRLVRENNALRERLRHLQPELTKARPPAPGIVVSPRGPIR